ncbi:ABC transporter permease subunit [Paralimibaculum aggregatum]|uniref:ABC transporter permease subunit n=1 Tax=Paralimibaculum aggregatum TaxID=3036245 RepID=A0ABQ6LNF4_9RHOB|nr:ABC transporter permease subunit [Limibaculum sp. NKW23]GMG82738.1 ABC transporter permease subunit [Limibaculum sp. NKW23]
MMVPLRNLPAPLPVAAPKPDRQVLQWVAVLAVAMTAIALAPRVGWIAEYPQAWTLPVADWVGGLTLWFAETFRGVFRAIAAAVEAPMVALQALLQGLPWCVTLGLVTLLAWQSGGLASAVFAAVSLFYIVVIGYWQESMSTLALVGIAIPLSTVLGFGLGVLSYRSARARWVIGPLLDLMQTVPAFAYLIPILLLFGFGPVVGLIASAIFAIPPMVRNTELGLARVPAEIRESALMSGCTRRQAFWWSEVPTALPQILVGINQTTMCALSMVIIAAIVGGFADIGWEVLSTMRKAQFGQSLLSGLVIVLLAVLLDRLTAGFARRSRTPLHDLRGLSRGGLAAAAAAIAAAGTLLAALVPALWNWPDALRLYPAEWLNGVLGHVTTEFQASLTAIEEGALFYVLLPIKIGLANAVAPFSWGISFAPDIKIAYFQGVALIAALAAWGVSWRLGVGAAICGGLLFYGVTGLPWPAFLLVVTLVAYQIGGVPVAGLALFAQGFLLLTGMWGPAMLSVYLCGAAVAVSVGLGVGLGMLAAASDRLSAVLRPVNDTLQTMPQFVLLIPALMFFGVGEFAALLAIVLYAMVPAIRYTEAGLRKVPPTLVEVAESVGCTRFQVFWYVKLPQAVPEILLGINQTILFALAMLVIAALVGTTGLGQQVYVALGKADAGQGFVAGLGMALIAMTADRIFQAAARERKRALGIG